MSIPSEIVKLHLRVCQAFNENNVEDYIKCFTFTPIFLMSGYPIVDTLEGLKRVTTSRIEDGQQKLLLHSNHAQIEGSLAYAIGEMHAQHTDLDQVRKFDFQHIYVHEPNGEWRIKSVFCISKAE